MNAPEIILTVLVSLFIGFLILFACNPLKKGQSYVSKPYYND